MRRVVVAAMALLFSMGVVGAAADRCKVTDPTGTPLNVRASPGGKITGKLPNGTLVSVAGYGDERQTLGAGQVLQHG
jgi:hypothetical protein